MMEQITGVLGRMHVLLLHLPIGIILMVFGLELYGRIKRRDIGVPVRFSLGIGALSAVLAAGCGWLLAEQGNYPPVLLDQHQWLGFGAAVLALSAWLLRDQRVYFPLLCFTVAVLSLAGHAGGTLTHGEGYLWAKQDSSPALQMATMEDSQTPVFEGWIRPILQNKCAGCHRTGKAKGGLILESAGTLRQGGRHGTVLVAGNAEESLLLQRMLLPEHAKEHMPPVGKPQPSDAEIALIRWWVEQGADFAVKIADAVPPPGLLDQLSAHEARHPVLDLNVDSPDAGALNDLRDAGARVDRWGAESPFYAVSLVARHDLTARHMKRLGAIGKNVVHLDVAGSNFHDELAGVLADLPHLIRLNLSRTEISDSGMGALRNAQYLEYLNISGTRISDAGLEALKGLPQLQTLYTWNTTLSRDGLAALASARPKLEIIGGAPDDTSKRLTLRAPRLVFSKTFFTDTLHVDLDFPFESVDLYYTLDQTTPGPQSERFTRPIVLDQTSTLKAVAIKDGWLPSPVVEASFIKRNNTPVAARLLVAPSPKYPAQGAASLFDGKIADVQGADTWLGYQGEDLTVVYDFGQAVDIGSVYVHCLENNAPWIFKPRAIGAWVSDDGKKWVSCGSRTFPENASMGTVQVHLLALPFERPAHARFARIKVQNIGKNPAWHPSAGEPCWMFVDEIVLD